MRSFLILLCSVVVVGCTQNDPQTIVDKAIAAAGGDHYLHSTIQFDFRGRHYIATREGGNFSYERIFKNDKDSTQTIHDFLVNDGFRREINGEIAEVADSMRVKYSASTNSVVYFALLPYGLNDASVKKKFLGTTELDGKSFYKIEVTFGKEGGGEDYEDVFNYWIDTEDYSIGYLSYSFSEEGKIGYRFRKAINPRRVEGILFLDYINFKPKGTETLQQLDDLFKSGELEELSKIELSRILVEKK